MAMKRATDAVNAYRQGYNCAMAVFSAYAPEFGVEPEMAARIGSPFGAGIAKTGEICGAVSGALMVIGLTQRLEEVRDPASREKVYALTRRFTEEFTARNGSVNCTELIGCDLSDPKEFAGAREKNLFATTCLKMVKDAGEILDGILSG